MKNELLTRISRSLLCLATIASAVALGGCAVDTAEAGDDQAVEEENVDSAEQALIGWGGWTSEEFGPLECDPYALVGAVEFRGNNSDDVNIYCNYYHAYTTTTSYWTSSFSEETPTGWCASNYYVSGIACSGSNCDNVSLRCTYSPYALLYDCHWTPWLSDETGGPYSFGGVYGSSGYVALGAQCSGSYCDNMRFYVCLP